MNSGFFGTKRTVHNIEVPHKRGICKERLDTIRVRLNYKPLKTDDVAVHEFFDSLLRNTDPLLSFFLFKTVSVVLYNLNAYLFKGDVQILDFFHIGRFYFLHIKRDGTLSYWCEFRKKIFRKKWIGSGNNIYYHLKHLHRRSWRQASSLT